MIGLIFGETHFPIQILKKIKKKHYKYLTSQNIFIFGIKPSAPSNEYGYFLTKKNKLKINKVFKFIEKPNISKAKKIIKKKGYWNSGMFFLRKESLINNFKKHQLKIYLNCFKSVKKAKYKNNIYYIKNTNNINIYLHNS